MNLKSLKRLLLICLLSPSAFASSHYGATFSYSLLGKEPPNLHGLQLMANYDPDCFHWRQFNVYFDAGYSHFWVPHLSENKNLNIYSAAPVVRYLFKKRGFLHPFLELSIGLAYLDRTHLDNRNLGMHFSFQDRMGLGANLGAFEQFSVGLHAVHYSNAHLSTHNSGITAPLVLDIGYRFA